MAHQFVLVHHLLSIQILINYPLIIFVIDRIYCKPPPFLLEVLQPIPLPSPSPTVSVAFITPPVMPRPIYLELSLDPWIGPPLEAIPCYYTFLLVVIFWLRGVAVYIGASK